MNIMQLQQYLIGEITTGYPDDFLVNLDEDQLREEFSTLLLVWSKNRHDVYKLQQAMSNAIASMVCRVTKTMDADPVELSAYDIHCEKEDAAYLAWKERNV
jgi:hypothetical protein